MHPFHFDLAPRSALILDIQVINASLRFINLFNKFSWGIVQKNGKNQRYGLFINFLLINNWDLCIDESKIMFLSDFGWFSHFDPDSGYAYLFTCLKLNCINLYLKLNFIVQRFITLGCEDIGIRKKKWGYC